MPGPEYLSIADFADTAGVSKQAVYKRLDKDLKPYLKIIDGRKCLEVSAIELFQTTPGLSTQSSTVETTKDKQSINYLMLQLQEKDRLLAQQQDTIKDQLAQIKELNAHIIDLSKAQTEILRKQSQLQENFQILLGQQQKQLAEFSQVSTVEKVQQPVDEPVVKPSETETPTNPGQPPEAEKKGFWSKVFGKK